MGVRHSGNEQYFENLIRALLRRPDAAEEYHVFSYRSAAARLFSDRRIVHVPLRSRSVWWQRAAEIPWHSRRLDLDVLHVPFNFLPAGRCRKVVTIHDLGFLHLPEVYAPVERLRMRVLTRMAARRADHVLAVSEFVKQDVVREYGIAAERVTVAPNAADRTVFRQLAGDERDAVRERMGLTESYLLFVGVIQARKNLLVVLRALETIRTGWGTNLHLVMVGRRGFKAEEVFRYVRDHALGGAVHHREVATAVDLTRLYNNALALVLPSVYEGFGIPILEAMCCGCPVISSRAGALPEVCGDAALTFDPRNTEELVARIEELIHDGGQRQRLIDRGLRNAERFSWDRTAALVREVYGAA